LLAGFAAASGIIRLESVIQAINAKFSDKVASSNIAAASEAYQFVIDEIAHARHGETAHA
ncbi:MAG TPA: 2-oxoacid:acceptor oxidoreductase, partial [Candidatus Accumulibacter sp.]|nr:2-oxoacid:acceptor oxidoreductase [Accumulibacter sp.]